ncbi:MAG: helix-turn-helix domain-containing protein [Gaiellaceae bacterium]
MVVVKMNRVVPPPEGPAETVGQRLRRLRHDRGLSQRELASPGVSYAYISRIEAGARRPSVKALRMLARELGVSADYLETGSEIRDTDQRELRIADAELELRLGEEPAKAEATLQRLRDDAVGAGDTVAAARANVALGLAAAAGGRNAEAIERLEAGLDRSPVSPSARPDVFATLGRAYAATGRAEEAVVLFERCLDEIAEDAPEDLTAQVRFTTYLSYALTDLNDLDRAQSVLATVLDKAEAMTDAYSRVRLYWSLARLNDVQGRPVAALDYVRRAIALLEVTDDTLHLARAHLLCGDILMTQGRPEEAGRHFDLAERLLGPNPEPVDAANLYTDQAKRAAALGDGDEAVRRAQAALGAVGEEFPPEKGNALWALAEGLALTGDTDGADGAFRDAAELLEHQGHRRDYVEAYGAWGKFLRRAGREDKALEVLERAADLAAAPVADSGAR